MNYAIMHKNIEVMDVEINEPAVAIIGIGAVHNAAHVPPGTGSMKGGIDPEELNDWFRGRAIPASRAGIRNLYAHLGRESTEYLILKCFALSLSDHYWVRRKGASTNWSEVNFFQNDFSRDVGEMLFGSEPADKKHINLMSPDNTSAGWLKKKWIITRGRRTLVKGGNEPWKQEPYNEVIAGAIMKRLGISHIPYSLTFDGGEPLCFCENFLSVQTELIPAWKVFHSLAINDTDSDYAHFLRCCDFLGIAGVRHAMDKMLAFDYIIANEDRHFNNFGFIRDADSLEWVGFAPIFDCGTSLWHNSLSIGGQRKCQPFCDDHEDQLRLVSDLSWFDIKALRGVENEIAEVFSRSPVIDGARSKAIAAAVLSRAETVARRKTELNRSA